MCNRYYDRTPCSCTDCERVKYSVLTDEHDMQERHRAYDAIKPASPREWEARLDEVAPKVYRIEPINSPPHNGLCITRIVVRPPDEGANNRLLGYARVTFNHCFGVWTRILARESGRIYLQFPNRKTQAGIFLDTANPITDACRLWVETLVLRHWQESQREVVA